jgi:S1-C subfamily serine protease
LGITSQLVELQAALRARLATEQASVLMVTGIEPGGPAEHAGFQPGDILLTLAGKAVTDPESLYLALGPEVVGQAIQAVVVRGGARCELPVTPVARP